MPAKNSLSSFSKDPIYTAIAAEFPTTLAAGAGEGIAEEGIAGVGVKSIAGVGAGRARGRIS